ncbi:Hypothetical protein CpMEX9_0981 [Corynebacterium pseudotuberculosis]|nr:hypothetical protein CpE55_0990 [Corynebacterium pseudotuberculosis]ANH25762.1 Hypothetical protein CpMEX9_0981 [Corynebacterium pseudotuberculosis]QGZ87698.1 hypothetical protein CpSigM_08140 [Corynebacterium pseudotuberculosis]QHO66053.1 hypothetical protein CpSigmaC_08155 [Corynebacterium pseudotuberculosis]
MFRALDSPFMVRLRRDGVELNKEILLKDTAKCIVWATRRDNYCGRL